MQRSGWSCQDGGPFLRAIQNGWQRTIVLVPGNAGQAVTWDAYSESITLHRQLIRDLAYLNAIQWARQRISAHTIFEEGLPSSWVSRGEVHEG